MVIREKKRREREKERPMFKNDLCRCKLLYIGWINNKVLLYSTGNYILYPVINHNGKKYEKIYE